MNGNRRAAARRPLKFACEIVRERDLSIVEGRTRDVSNDGFLLRTSAPLLTGEDVIVSFREPRSGRYVDAVARVARIIHGRRRGDGGRSFGLRIESMDAASRRDLQGAMKGVPPVVPGRALSPRANVR
jgi:hypothetical protein